MVTGAKEVGQRTRSAGKELDPQGRKLHESAKAFGESIWGSMQAFGRSARKLFTGQ